MALGSTTLAMLTGRRLSVPNTAIRITTMAPCTSANTKPSDARVNHVCAVSRTPATRDSHQTATYTKPYKPVGAVPKMSSA